MAWFKTLFGVTFGERGEHVLQLWEDTSFSFKTPAKEMEFEFRFGGTEWDKFFGGSAEIRVADSEGNVVVESTDEPVTLRVADDGDLMPATVYTVFVDVLTEGRDYGGGKYPLRLIADFGGVAPKPQPDPKPTPTPDRKRIVIDGVAGWWTADG